MSEVYESAGLTDDLSLRQLPDRWIFDTLDKLRRRYPKQFNVRWVNPYSLLGLYVAVRFRIRSYPTIIVGSTVLGKFSGPEELEQWLAARIERELEADQGA